MKLDQRDEGDYRIYGGVIEAAHGEGYIAAVVVNQVRNIHPAPREIFRDEAVACGQQWPSRDAALSFAMDKGREVVKTAQHRLGD